MKLNTKRTALVGLAFMSISIFWQLYEFVVPLVLRDTFLMGDGATNFIMSLDNVLALFMLPVFGRLSDRIDTRIGRRMPFILAGTGIVVITLFIAPPSYVQVPPFWKVLIPALFPLMYWKMICPV